MWLLFLMWCAIIASVPVHHNVLQAFALHGAVKQLPDIFWNTSNPIFRIDNTDHIIDVNKGGGGEYDRVNIICPKYSPSTDEKETEKFIIYEVTKDEYDSCMIRRRHPRIIAHCGNPYKDEIFTITFRSFSPSPGALEFHPGHDYYFISTSSEDDLHRRLLGMCLTKNMRIVIKVADLIEQQTTTKSSLSEKEGATSKDQKDNQILDSDIDNAILVSNTKNNKKTMSKHGKNKNRKNRNKRRKNRDRKKKNSQQQHKQQNNNGDTDWDDAYDKGHPEDTNIFQNRGINNRNGINNNYDPYLWQEDNYGEGGMPSKEHSDTMLKDNPRNYIQQEPSMVAKVQDLMKHEASISASSPATSTNVYTAKPYLGCSFVFLLLTHFLQYFYSSSQWTFIIQ